MEKLQVVLWEELLETVLLKMLTIPREVKTMDIITLSHVLH
jgi:hypothetical protein